MTLTIGALLKKSDQNNKDLGEKKLLEEMGILSLDKKILEMAVSKYLKDSYADGTELLQMTREETMSLNYKEVGFI